MNIEEELKLLTPEQCVLSAIDSAERAGSKIPEAKVAIQAAKDCLKNPCEETRQAAKAAADAAADADAVSYAAYWAARAAHYAAFAAAYDDYAADVVETLDLMFNKKPYHIDVYKRHDHPFFECDRCHVIG
ncbi:MAG: hypothetical protein GY804_02810 [Alphaproteobacteria bacterium]|nr:hypothetical protein [Alphaproteobacteria bacterium]